jgi:hypothetical protein
MRLPVVWFATSKPVLLAVSKTYERESATGVGRQPRKQALGHAIEIGRGGVFLKLTPEQYARLRRP